MKKLIVLMFACIVAFDIVPVVLSNDPLAIKQAGDQAIVHVTNFGTELIVDEAQNMPVKILIDHVTR